MNLHRADVNQESGPSCLPTMIEKTHLQKARVGLTNDDCVVGPPVKAARTPDSALILRRDGMREMPTSLFLGNESTAVRSGAGERDFLGKKSCDNKPR